MADRLVTASGINWERQQAGENSGERALETKNVVAESCPVAKCLLKVNKRLQDILWVVFLLIIGDLKLEFTILTSNSHP